MEIDAPVSTTLESLPAEIIEHIALHLGFPHSRAARHFARDFFNLRATSKSIEVKTRHAFMRVFFSTYPVDYSILGLAQLQKVAVHPEFRKVVDTLCFRRVPLGFHENSALDWMLERSQEEQADRMEFDAGGEGPLVLFTAFSLLPNLTCIEIGDFPELAKSHPWDYDDDRFAPYSLTSRTNVFRQILAAVSLAMVPLRTLKMHDESKIKAQAFELSGLLPFPFSDIQELKLSICMLYKEPSWSNFGVVDELLLAMPSLTCLCLLVSDNKRLERMYGLDLDQFITLKPPGTTLKRCHLEGIVFGLRKSESFLGHHKNTLASLVLHDCDLMSVPEDELPGNLMIWPAIFEQLKAFQALQYVSLRQIGYNWKRTYFETCGEVEQIEFPPSLEVGGYEGWVMLGDTDPFAVKILEFEDMAVRLRELQLDFRISELDWTSDAVEDDEFYWRWF